MSSRPSSRGSDTPSRRPDSRAGGSQPRIFSRGTQALTSIALPPMSFASSSDTIRVIPSTPTAELPKPVETKPTYNCIDRRGNVTDGWSIVWTDHPMYIHLKRGPITELLTPAEFLDCNLDKDMSFLYEQYPRLAQHWLVEIDFPEFPLIDGRRALFLYTTMPPDANGHRTYWTRAHDFTFRQREFPVKHDGASFYVERPDGEREYCITTLREPVAPKKVRRRRRSGSGSSRSSDSVVHAPKAVYAQPTGHLPSSPRTTLY